METHGIWEEWGGDHPRRREKKGRGAAEEREVRKRGFE